MRAKRKLVTMIVTVSVPANMGKGEARGITRLAIANGYILNPGISAGVKLRSVQSAAEIEHYANMARKAWGEPIKGPAPRKRDGTPPLLEAMGAK